MTVLSCDSVCCMCRGLEQSLIDDAVDQWLITHLRPCVRANDGHCEHTLWLSVCFLCTLWTFFYTTLDAVGNRPILRAHYESMKCDVSFLQGSVSTLFRWGKHVLPDIQQCKNYTNQTSFSRELWSQMYCHVFYESQCTYIVGGCCCACVFKTTSGCTGSRA